MEFSPVVFFETDPEVIVNRIIDRYKLITGKKDVHPSDIERLIFDSCAYEIMLSNISANSAVNQMFVQGASAPILDYLGYNVGVERLPASNAKTVIRFTLVGGHGNVTIPIGTRVTSSDGLAVFETLDDVLVPVGVNTVDIDCEAFTEGIEANNYIIGSINRILDPQVFLTSAANLTVTGGGSLTETDERLKTRIFLALSALSTAGSVSSYKFHALSAHPSIIDVGIIDPPLVPGTVQVYPLVDGGIETPDVVLDAVRAVLTSEKVRPLTDTVEVISPVAVDYSLTIVLTPYLNVVQPEVLAASIKSVTDYTEESKNKLNRNITKDKITKLAMVEGVYNINIGGFSDLNIEATQFPNCTSVLITMGPAYTSE